MALTFGDRSPERRRHSSRIKWWSAPRHGYRYSSRGLRTLSDSTPTMRAKTLPLQSSGVGDRTPQTGGAEAVEGRYPASLAYVWYAGDHSVGPNRAALPIFGRQCQRRRSNRGGVRALCAGPKRVCAGAQHTRNKGRADGEQGETPHTECRKQPRPAGRLNRRAPVLARMYLSAYV